MSDLTHAELVEKVARSIMLARGDGGCEVKDWVSEELYNPHVAQALAQACAAISTIAEALKEPTEAMEAAHDAAVIRGLSSDNFNRWASFTAMLLASPLYEEGK